MNGISSSYSDTIHSKFRMPDNQKTRWRWPDWAYASSITVVAGILRFHALDHKSFWFDEGSSVAIARLDWYNFLRLIWRREANMTFYYLLLRGWQHLGGSEFFIRSLSVLFAIATVPAIYLLARELFNRRVAAISSLLLAVNAYNIRYAQEARSYALYVLLATLSCAALVSYVASPTSGKRRTYIACSVLAVYSHFYFAFLIVAQWLALRLKRPEHLPTDIQKSFRWIAALTFPAFIFAASTGVGPLRWIQRPSGGDLYMYFDYLAGNGRQPLLFLCLVLIATALVSCGRDLWHRNVGFETWRCQFLLIVLLFPVVLICLLSYARPLFVPRYFVACQPPFLILVAAGIDRLPRWWWRTAAVSLLVLLSLRATIGYYQNDFDLARDDYRSTSRYILDHARPGDGLMFDVAQARMGYEFYRSLYTGPGLAPFVVYPHRGDTIEYHDFLGRPTVELVRMLPEHYERVWVVFKTAGAPTTPDAIARRLAETLNSEYANLEEHSFPGLVVRMYSGTRHR